MRLISSLFIGLLALLVLQGCSGGADTGGKSAGKTQVPKSPSRPVSKAPGLPVPKSPSPNGTLSKQVTLYFSTSDVAKLVGETRSVASESDLPLQAVRLLIEGPSSTDLRPTIPPGTRLLGVEVIAGVAYVDFSKQFVDNHPGGSAAEIATVYSVVNTLTALPGIDKVAFKVDGKPLALLKGHLDLSEPLGRDTGLITGS